MRTGNIPVGNREFLGVDQGITIIASSLIVVL
jgi:hypothetical protein